MRTPEQIIKEGNELKHPSSMIAQEIKQDLIEKLVQSYIMRKQTFNGLESLLEFREFLEKSI